MSATSSGYTALDMDCPLHSSQLSLSEGHELEGQVITVPTGIEAPTLLTEIVVGLKLVPSAATPGKASPKHKRKSKSSLFMTFSLVACMLPEERVHGSHSLFDEAHLQEEVRVGIGVFFFLSTDARCLQAAEAKIRVQSKNGHQFIFRH